MIEGVLKQRASDKVESGHFQPISDWIGHLTFHKENRHASRDDGVSIQLQHAPNKYKHLIGKILPLRWNERTADTHMIESSTHDVAFTDLSWELAKGSDLLVCSRLDGLKGVGPLESLAAAEPDDTVFVILKGDVEVVMEDDNDNGQTTLMIEDHPVQISGVYYCVVTIQERVRDDLFLVKHYDVSTKEFTGPETIARIPNAENISWTRNGEPDGTAKPSSNIDIEKSPENPNGWYLYGDFVTSGEEDGEIFQVEAIEAVTALSLSPTNFVNGKSKAFSFVNDEYFKKLKSKVGKVETTLVDVGRSTDETSSITEEWREGDQYLVAHLFGGIKNSTRNETTLGFFCQGHLAYGFGTVILDPITNMLRLDIEYCQIYAQNSIGLISGPVKRSHYMGNLRNGWLGIRPVCDYVVNCKDLLQDFIVIDKEDSSTKHTISPLKEFHRQLCIRSAMYRTGSGEGVSNVTSANNCTQDSNQALYVSLQIVESEISKLCEEGGRIDPTQASSYKKFERFADDVSDYLAPLWARRDWRKSAKLGSSGGSKQALHSFRKVFRSLLSFNTIIPRTTFDNAADVFLRYGGKLWYILTVAVGGDIDGDKSYVPLEPSKFLTLKCLNCA